MQENVVKFITVSENASKCFCLYLQIYNQRRLYGYLNECFYKIEYKISIKC